MNIKESNQLDEYFDTVKRILTAADKAHGSANPTTYELVRILTDEDFNTLKDCVGYMCQHTRENSRESFAHSSVNSEANMVKDLAEAMNAHMPVRDELARFASEMNTWHSGDLNEWKRTNWMEYNDTPKYQVVCDILTQRDHFQRNQPHDSGLPDKFKDPLRYGSAHTKFRYGEG